MAPTAIAVLVTVLTVLPNEEALALPIELMAMVLVALLLAPTWKLVAEKEPSNQLVPLKEELLATRVISEISCCAWLFKAALSLALLLPLAACTARVRIC